MAVERSTIETWQQNANQQQYDWEYYKVLLPHIIGDVLDIGSGALMFVKEYSKKDNVMSVTCLDKFQEINIPDKVFLQEWICPQPLPDLVTFNTIVSTEFIEHIEREQLEPLLGQIVKIMGEYSQFIGSTPNKKVPTQNPYHLYEYTLNELKEIFDKYFSQVEMYDNGQNCTVWVCQL